MNTKNTANLIAALIIGIILCVQVSADTSLTATNMVVDFTATSLPSDIQRGDSKVMNLVIKNSGGYNAQNVQIYIPSTGTVRVDKRFYVGDLTPGESKTIPIMFTIPDDARTGQTAIQAKITYDGYRSDGTVNNDQLSSWEIPLTIEGNPLFQINPAKSTFYRGSLENYELDGLSKDNVDDLEITLSSDCLNIIGSTRKYIGRVNANQSFTVAYPIKPSTNGACTSYMLMSYKDETGAKSNDNVTLGISVENPSVDFKVITTELPPGKQTNMTIIIHNTGTSPLENIKFSWTTDKSLILPVGSDNTKRIKYIDVNDSVELTYGIIVDSNADPGLYNLQLMLAYDDATNTNNSVLATNAGIYIGGGTEFSVAFSESTKGETSFSIANTGSNPAYSVEVNIPKQDGWTIKSSPSTIIGNLNKGDYTTASFNLIPGKTSGDSTINMQLYYTDTSGNRQTVNKQVELDTSMITTETDTNKTAPNESNTTMPVIIGVIVVAIAAIVYKRYIKK